MSTDNISLNPDALLTEREAASLASLSVRTLQTWRVRGGGPQFAKLGGAVRYRRRDIEAWIAARLVRTTGEAQSRK